MPGDVMTDAIHTDSTESQAFCPDGCTADCPHCAEGLALFADLRTTLEQAGDLAFYRRPVAEREAFWRVWNGLANRYLAHCRFSVPPIDYAGFHQDYQRQKVCARCQATTRWVVLLRGGKTVLCCSQCHERERLAIACLVQKLGWVSQWPENGSALSIFVQVRGWIEEEWLLGSQLDNRFEDWQMGFPPESLQWAAYSRYYGVFLADSGEPYIPQVSGKNAMHYHWGSALVVLCERVADLVAAAVRIEENNVDAHRLAYAGGAGGECAPNDYARYSLGPSLVERLGCEEMRARIAAMPGRDGEAFLAWFDRLPEQLVDCYRYTLQGGQRLLYVHCALGADYHLLLADTPAGTDDPNWRARFPAHVFA